MLKSEIHIGKHYALREKRARGAPLQRVRILEHVRGTKWKAEWVEPNAGLVDYVDSSWLIVPWKDQKALLREEAAAERLREHNERTGFKDESPLSLALEQVFGSTGDDVFFSRGTLEGSSAAIDRIRVRAGLAVGTASPVGYVDRQGRTHLPFDEALELGRKFSAAEPAAVLVRAESTEREWSQEAQRPGGEYLVSLLNEYQASWALIRQWASHDAAVAQREAQIQKLERLVWDAVYALQKAGLDSEAARLRRTIERK